MSQTLPIHDLVSSLRADFGLTPVTAAEIEFYLHGSEAHPALPMLWIEVRVACEKAGIAIAKIEKESGRGQHEIAPAHVADAAKTASDTQRVKEIVSGCAAAHGMQADFAAKPRADQPGCGLHFHIHLEDGNGRDVFFKRDEEMSEALRYSLGGLLATLPDTMPMFAPNEASYLRFTANEGASHGRAPVTVSWGGNNRTVAVRLPDAPHDKKRIEHRVAGADADPQAALAAILAGIHYGLKHRCDPGAQQYGDAALPMYNLPRLPTTLAEARERMEKSEKLKGYFIP